MANEEPRYRGYRDLKVYQLSYALAMDVFRETRSFPVEERYSLVDQLRRSSRSIVANIAEAWKKRRYEKMFVSKLTDCSGEAAEVEVWLDFSLDCGYLTKDKHEHFVARYDEVSRMLYSMIDQPEKFCKQ
jgi:four helix bundle protein